MEGGSIKTHRAIIDKEYLRKNEVWVISLNDRTPEMKEGQYLRQVKLSSVNASCDPNNSNWTDGYIATMKIRQHYESLFSGKNDIRAFTNSSWDDGTDFGWVVSSSEREIAKFSRDDVDFQRTKAVNFLLYPGWNPPNSPNPTGALGDMLYFIIYEHDNWPAGLRSKSNTVPWTGYQINWIYRSSDESLTDGTILGFQKAVDFWWGPIHITSLPQTSCDYTWNDSAIEFETTRN